jgi:streptogramin lyase
MEEHPFPSAAAACRTVISDPAGAIWCPESGPSKLARFGS